MLDNLMSEYGWTIEYTLTVSLAQAFALYAAILVRHNQDLPGPSYLDREIMAALSP